MTPNPTSIAKTQHHGTSGTSSGSGSETLVPHALPKLPNQPEFPHSDSATAVLLAVSVLIGAISELIRTLVPVMLQRSETKVK